MLSQAVLVGVAAAAALANAAPTANTSGFENPSVQYSTGGNAICVSGLVPVTARSTQNIQLNFALPSNQSQVTEAFVSMIASGSPFTSEVMGPAHTVSGTWDISATLCYPATASGPSNKTVQFLTHGVGFGKSYWDFAAGQSYVDVAAARGYTTFSYDRLGIGQSEHPDPIQVVQAPLEVSIAAALISMLKSGKFAGQSFMDVVGVGHSFGSVLTTGLAAMTPSPINAAVLTGFSANMTAQPLFLSALNLAIASINAPYRFANLSNGYLVSGTIVSNQFDFFHAPNFDPNILVLAEATKETVTFGELLTMSALSKPASKFTGPIDVVDGAADLPFCFGNCSYPTNQAAAVKASLFPKASSRSAFYLASGAGHALNLHYSATAAFEQIQAFIKKNGF